jgi:hypothetical protein
VVVSLQIGIVPPLQAPVAAVIIVSRDICGWLGSTRCQLAECGLQFTPIAQERLRLWRPL